MKKTLAAVALAGALSMTACSAQTASTAAQSPAPSTTSSAPAPSQTATQAAPAASASATPSGVANALAQGIKDKIMASAGDTAKYLPSVRGTVKMGTDDELINYGVEFCAAGTTNGVNALVADMTSKGYTKDNAMTVAVSAGFFLCPKK